MALPDERAAHERGLACFLQPDQARRVRALTDKPRPGREKACHMLAHKIRFAPGCFVPVPTAEQDAAGVLGLLIRAGQGAIGAGSPCYTMGASFDGLLMPLETALGLIVGQASGTVLSCIPGRLGYYEGEEPGRRYILRYAP